MFWMQNRRFSIGFFQLFIWGSTVPLGDYQEVRQKTIFYFKTKPNIVIYDRFIPRLEQPLLSLFQGRPLLGAL